MSRLSQAIDSSRRTAAGGGRDNDQVGRAAAARSSSAPLSGGTGTPVLSGQSRLSQAIDSARRGEAVRPQAWQDNESGFQNWIDELNRFSQRMSSEYAGREGRYQSAADLGQYRDSAYDSIRAMQRQSEAYRSFFEGSRDLYGDMTVNGILAALDQGGSYLEGVRSSLGSEYDYWSQWASEQDYNDYRRRASLDIDAAKAELAALEAQVGAAKQERNTSRNIMAGSRYMTADQQAQYGQRRQEDEARYAELDGRISALREDIEIAEHMAQGRVYSGYLDADDFKELSRYASTANGKEEVFNAWSGTYTETGFDDITYDYINRNETARGRQMVNDISTNASFLGVDKSFLKQMTDDEIAIFNYLYAAQGAQPAYEYINFLASDLNYRQRVRSEAEWAAYAKENPIGSSVFSVLESPLKGLSYLGQTADYLEDGKIDQNAAYNKFSYLNTAIRGQVARDIEENVGGFWGQAGSFGYQTGMSMGDFLFNTAITGGNEALTLAIMGTEAAADATIAAKDRGLTDDQAFTLGTIAGAAEIITERVSLETLLNKTAMGKNAVGYLLKNVFAEGSEEVAADFINLFADILVAKDKSEWQVSINAYQSEGMDETEAFWRAVLDQAQTMGLDFLGGGISGGVLAGGAIGFNATMNEYGARQTGAQFRGMGDDVVQATIQEGLASDPSTRSYQLARQLQQKLDQGGTLTDAEIGRLYQANVEAVEGENGELLLTRAAEEAAEKGRLTNDTASEILRSDGAIHTLTQEAGLELSDDMTKAQRRAAVKEAVDRLASRETAAQENTADTETTQRQGTQSAPVTGTERTAARQAFDMRIMRQAASALGENGAKALAAAYDGSVNADGFYAGFAAYYEAGVSGLAIDKVKGRYSGQLNEAQRYAAYTAGQNDAAASLAAEREGVKSATVYGDEAGFIQTEQSKHLPRSTVRLYDSVARAVGIKIQLAPATGKGGENGWYANGILHIAQDAENPGQVVAKHEVTHRMQELAPEEYRRYRDYAINAMAERDGSSVSIVEQYKARYAQNGINLTTEQAMDEIAADFTEHLVTDPQQFERLARQNRSAAQKLVDAVRDFIRRVKTFFRGNQTAQNRASTDVYGIDLATLEEAERLWSEALEAAKRQASALSEQEQRIELSDVNTRYSLRQKDPPQKIGIAYKVFLAKDGQLYPPMVANPGGAGTPVGVWLDADIGQAAPASKTGRAQVQGGGKGTAAGKISLAFRPGWHLGDIPLAKQFARKNPQSGIKDLFPADFVWAECEYAMDVDYQEEAMSYGYTENGKFRHAYAGLPKLPTDGYYRYRTNPNPDTVPWIITGAMRVTRILTDAETDAICREAGVEPMRRQGGPIDLSAFGLQAGDAAEQARFSLKAPVEETKNLLAMHNLDEEKLMKALALGGFPMPSIAITRTDIPHTNFGDITLIFGKETIDPKFDRRNTVYSADAWTPTFPQTEYEINEKVAARLRNKFYELSKIHGRDAVDALYAWGNYAEDQLNREGGEAAVLAKLRDSADMMKAYLLDSGLEVPETVRTEMVTRMDEAKIKQYDYLIEGLGRDIIDEMKPAGDETPMSARRRWIDAHGAALEEVYRGYLRDIGGLSEAEIENVTESPSFSAKSLMREVVEARRYLANGPEARTTSVDAEATRQAILEATDQEAYQAWLKDLFGGIEKSSGIYNGKERYTSSGNLRSFKATHLPVTLENIAKAMAAEGDGDSRNVSGFYGVKSLRAGMAARFSSIEDMHRLEGRLKHLTEEEAAQVNEALGNRMTAIMEEIIATKPRSEYDNQFYAFDTIGNILMEACRAKKITIDSIIGEFSGTGYRVGTDLAAKIRDLLFDIGEMKVNIFEAKPERAVRFDEVLAAVLPDSAGEELRRGLAEAGVRTLEYRSGDDADRLAKVNSVDGARFSLKRSGDIQREVAALREENDLLRERVDYWRGQTRRTERVTTDKKAVERAARALIQDYGADIRAEDIQDGLQSLYDYIASGFDGKDELTYTEARRRAEAIAQTLVENAVSVDDESYRQYSDLRDYLRTVNLVYGKEYHGDIADFGFFRRSLFGKLNLKTKGNTNVDQVYQEMSERWPEFFNEQAESHPTDQLLRIAEVLDGIYNVTEYNPFSLHMEEAVAGAANEIMEGFFDLPQTRATFADRQARKLEDAKAKGRQQAQRVREQGNARLEKLRTQNRQRVQQVIERERSVRERQLQRLRDHYAETRQNQAERRADSKARSRLLNIARRLQNKKLPAVSRALLDQYIGDLDTTAKSMTGKTLARLSDLREWYDDRKRDDPDFISDPAIEADLARLSKRHISDLTAEEVADLTRVLLNIENELRTERQLIDSEDRRDVYLQGVQVINDVENSGGSREGIRGAFDNYIVTETLSPVRQIKRMAGYVKSDPLIRLVNALADGQRESLSYQMEAERPFRKWAENSRFRRDFSGAKAKTVSISGLVSGKGVVTVEITPAMRAALYLHSLNDQNLRHIRDGGVTVPDMRLYRKGKLSAAYARGTTIKLTPSQVRNIAAGMTAEERAFAKAVHDYFNGQSRERINAVSEKLKGYPIAQVEHYFPIRTDSSFTRADFESLKFDGTLEGMGFLKERQAKAANPILLQDANAALEQSIAQHSKYVGLAIPVRNFNKVWGVTKSSFNDDGSRNAYESSVQKAVKKAWGESGYNYVEKLMTDLQSGANAKNIWIRLLNKVRGNYAGAVLTLNMSVAMKQAASYPTAAAVLGWRPLARAMGDVGKVDLDLIARYTPLQWYRSKGFSIKELGDLRQTDGPVAKVMNHLPTALNWVQGVDLITTRKLWKAAEYYVRANQKGLGIGTDAYYRAVAEVYNRVIEETQPNYTTMQRPQLLRSDDSLLGNLAMFKTQPFQNFNILYDAIGEYRAARKNGADIRAARANLNRAVTSQLVQLAVFAGMTMAWAMFRGKREKYEDEDGEMTLLSVLKALGKDMAGGGLSSVPFGSDAWELLSSRLFGDPYYGMDAVTVTALTDTVSSMNGMGELLGDVLGRVSRGDDVDWNTVRIKMDGYLDDISKAAGIPYENAANLFNASYRHICIAALGEYQGEYAALKLTAEPERQSKRYYDLLYRAMVNSPDEYKAIYQDMVESGSFEAEKIKAAMEDRMKTAQGVEKVGDLEQRFLTPAQEQTYSGLRRQITGDGVWSAATAEQRDAAEDDLYNLIVGNGAGDKLQEKIDAGAAYGIDEADYILYRLALRIADQPNDSGKLGTYTNEEMEAALAMLTGLSDAAKSYLWEAQGKSEKSNPYK